MRIFFSEEVRICGGRNRFKEVLTMSTEIFSGFFCGNHAKNVLLELLWLNFFKTSYIHKKHAR